MSNETVFELDEGIPPQFNSTAPLDSQCAAETSLGSDDLLGAVDIVEAFTALRHELKLQVRGGRELQQAHSENLRRIEDRIAMLRAAQSASAASDDGRELALAVAEMEESLQRAHETLARQSQNQPQSVNVVERFDRSVASASWLARKFAGKLLNELNTVVRQSAAESQAQVEFLGVTQRGLELLLLRVHRLMERSEIKRVDVAGRAFDAETMHALDVVTSTDVPSSHVAEQLRPAYVWRGKILRCADVRLAR